MNGVTHIVVLPPHQSEALRSLKDQTGLSMAELVRRGLDLVLHEQRLGELVPSLSGHLSLGRTG